MYLSVPRLKGRQGCGKNCIEIRAEDAGRIRRSAESTVVAAAKVGRSNISLG
jgi:hypothetical protein